MVGVAFAAGHNAARLVWDDMAAQGLVVVAFAAVVWCNLVDSPPAASALEPFDMALAVAHNLEDIPVDSIRVVHENPRELAVVAVEVPDS